MTPVERLESIQNEHKDSDIDSEIKSIIDDYQWFIDHTQTITFFFRYSSVFIV
jgi:hypothetical protein